MNIVRAKLYLITVLLAASLVAVAAPTAAADDGTSPAVQRTWSLVSTGEVVVHPSSLVAGSPASPLIYTYLDGSILDYSLLSRTAFGNPLVLHVVTGEPGDEWVEVIVPVRPLQTRWVRTAGFAWRAHDTHGHVVLEDFSLDVYAVDGSGVIGADRLSVGLGIGRPSFPTPLGATYIDEIVADSGVFAPYLFSLALFSEAFNTLGDGLPKIAIRGTSDTDHVFAASTNGALRTLEGDMEDLLAFMGAEQTPGTPVTIWPTASAFDASLLACGGATVTVDIGAGQVPTDGDDVIMGTAGDDVIAAGPGDDIVCGLGGNDSIWGQDGNDVLFGGAGMDRIRGGDGDDRLLGGAGADDLNGGRNDDHVSGGDGDDQVVRGGTGDDFVTGGPGNDLLVSGNGGRDLVDGGDGDDVMRGGPRPDVLFGGAGMDAIQGLGGADQIFGGPGNDSLFGGKQPDTIDGGLGVDQCAAGLDGATLAACE